MEERDERWEDHPTLFQDLVSVRSRERPEERGAQELVSACTEMIPRLVGDSSTCAVACGERRRKRTSLARLPPAPRTLLTLRCPLPCGSERI